MPFSTDRPLRRWTLPLAAVASVLLPLLLPENGRLENAVNRALPSQLDQRLILIGIDDASLSDYGRLDVWPRELYDAALRTLSDAGVQAVGVDVLLGSSTGDNLPLNPTFKQMKVVLATPPGDVPVSSPKPSTFPTGVSALNIPSFGAVREVQTGYPMAAPPSSDGELVASFARQVAAQVAPPLPLDTTRHLIRYVRPQDIAARTLSFRDVVNGHVKFAEMQGKVAVMGLTANGLADLTLPDIDRAPIAGTALQLRAISSLLAPPLRRVPVAWIMLACLVVSLLTMQLRGSWGFWLIGAALLLAVPLWRLNIVFPGVTVSLAALFGAGLVAFEQWWQVRRSATHDYLTGFGNRLAFTRAVEQRWRTRQERPVGLLLIDLDNLRQIRELHGRLTGERALKLVAERIQGHKRRGDLSFRWGSDEFAVLLDQGSAPSVTAAIEHYFQGLKGLQVNGLNIQVNVGGAVTGEEIATPVDLIDAASRSRYRLKYQRELQSQTESEATS